MRQKRSDSVAGMIDAAKNAREAIPGAPATVDMTAAALRMWPVVVGSRPANRWSDIELHTAALLARCMADIEEQRAIVLSEGITLQNDRGTYVKNPRYGVIESLTQNLLSLTRALALQTNSHQAKKDIASADAMHVKAKKVFSEVIEEDSLLA